MSNSPKRHHCKKKKFEDSFCEFQSFPFWDEMEPYKRQIEHIINSTDHKGMDINFVIYWTFRFLNCTSTSGTFIASELISFYPEFASEFANFHNRFFKFWADLTIRFNAHIQRPNIDIPLAAYINNIRIDIVNTIAFSRVPKKRVQNNIVALKNLIDEKIPPAYCRLVHFLFKCHSSCFCGDIPLVNQPAAFIIKHFAFFFDLVKVIFHNIYVQIRQYIADFLFFFGKEQNVEKYLVFRQGIYLSKKFTLETAFSAILESNNACISPDSIKTLTNITGLIRIRDIFKNYSEFRDLGFENLKYLFPPEEFSEINSPLHKIEFQKYAQSVFRDYMVEYIATQNERVFSLYPEIEPIIMPIFSIPYQSPGFAQQFQQILFDPNKKFFIPHPSGGFSPEEQKYIDEFDFI